MSDSIEIMASAAHANVASELRGVSVYLAGWTGGGIPLNAQAKGTPLDVSDYVQLRLDLTVASMKYQERGAGPQLDEHGRPMSAILYVRLEHLVGAEWLELHRFAPMTGPGTQLGIVVGLGTSVRASYYFARTADLAGTVNENVEITWSLTADALPEA